MGIWRNKAQRKALIWGAVIGFAGAVFLPAQINPSAYLAKIKGA